MVAGTVIPSLEKAVQPDCEVWVSLDQLGKPYEEEKEEEEEEEVDDGND